MDLDQHLANLRAAIDAAIVAYDTAREAAGDDTPAQQALDGIGSSLRAAEEDLINIDEDIAIIATS